MLFLQLETGQKERAARWPTTLQMLRLVQANEAFRQRVIVGIASRTY